MTPSTKPTTRETSAAIRDSGKLRPVIVTIHHGTITMRLKGTRRAEHLDVASAFNRAIKDRVWVERMAKAKERAAKRGRK